MDFGAVVNGYCADMTRTVAVGEVSGEQKEVYDVVLKAQQAALSMLGPGRHSLQKNSLYCGSGAPIPILNQGT